MELKLSCSSCKHAKIKLPWVVNDKNGKYLYTDSNNRSSENTIFICSLYPKEKEVHRKDICGHHKLHSTFRSEKIEYCPECNGETYSKDWYCSRCWCDRDDSELFEEGLINRAKKK